MTGNDNEEELRERYTDDMTPEEYKIVYDNICDMYHKGMCGMDLMEDMFLVRMYACEEDGIPFSCEGMPNASYRKVLSRLDGTQYLVLDYGMDRMMSELPLRTGMEDMCPAELAEAFHIFSRLPLEWSQALESIDGDEIVCNIPPSLEGAL